MKKTIAVLMCSLMIVGCTPSISTTEQRKVKDSSSSSKQSIYVATKVEKKFEEKEVVEKIKRLKGIIGVEAATEETDLNRIMNKPGGYVSAIYFRHEKVEDFKGPDGKDTPIIELGTLGGGSIETFKNEEDAKKRNKYLSSFDGASFPKVGSHIVLGKHVIRTSDNLTATQQKELEKELIEILK